MRRDNLDKDDLDELNRKLENLRHELNIIDNPEIITNYENVINWLLATNVLVILFVSENYSKFTTTPDNAPSFLLYVLFILGTSSLIGSTLGLFLTRIWIFKIMNESLLTLGTTLPTSIKQIDTTDIKAVLEKIKIFREISIISDYMKYSIQASGLGLLLLLLYISFNLSVLMGVIVLIICSIFAGKGLRFIKKTDNLKDKIDEDFKGLS